MRLHRQTVNKPSHLKKKVILNPYINRVKKHLIMPTQIGINRDQLEFNSLEALVDSDSEVRVIDLFLDRVDYDGLGSTNQGSSFEGRTAVLGH